MDLLVENGDRRILTEVKLAPLSSLLQEHFSQTRTLIPHLTERKVEPHIAPFHHSFS